MLTIIAVVMVSVLLVGGAIFAIMSKDNNRRGQSGTPRVGGDTPTQGRASGLN